MQQVVSFWNLLPQAAVDSIKRFKKEYTDSWETRSKIDTSRSLRSNIPNTAFVYAGRVKQKGLQKAARPADSCHCCCFHPLRASEKVGILYSRYTENSSWVYCRKLDSSLSHNLFRSYLP